MGVDCNPCLATWLIICCFHDFSYSYSPEGEGVYCITSVRLSVRPSFRPSKIFFVAFFSATIDGRNPIFGHKLHVGTPYKYAILWVAFLDPSDSYFLFADLVGFYTHWTYMYMHIFLSNSWWHKFDIWSQASCRYPISWEVFLDPSDSYFLFADLVDFYAHWTYMRGYHKWTLAHSSSFSSLFKFANDYN